MSHHGFDEEAERRMREVMKDIFGEFPNGRLNPQDQGAMAVSIGQENGAVVLRFPRNLNWIGFTPDQAIDIAETLVKHARACGSKKPLTLTIG